MCCHNSPINLLSHLAHARAIHVACLPHRAMLLLATLLPCVSSAMAPRPVLDSLSRRSAAAALLSLPALCLRPDRASAFLGFGEGPQGEFRELGRKRAQLADLADQLEKKDLRGEVDEDAIVVLNTLTIQFRGTEQLLDKTTAALDRLAPDDIAKAQMISKLVLEELENVRQGARERAPRKQLSATEDAGNAIDKYLALAGTKYTLPEADVSLAYSSDPAKFAAQYYGVFSCEGQGLERVKGSNTCKDSKENNKNPFPTKKLLDFDFLTGETLPTNK